MKIHLKQIFDNGAFDVELQTDKSYLQIVRFMYLA